MNTKYLSFILRKITKKHVNQASGNPKLMSNVMQEIIIPIPPISIQNKIVEILDKLETYTKDINTGLPLEIEQRKKQYEYYRNKLLDFDNIARERERES
ncbi:restriction endonuclease subunit S [Ureaplasma parvum]|uniref:restriction endonuclease subunit S n=1 Tax=Ureaplasma parvum TaxID=134821 RepID=UPI00307E3A83